MAFVVEVVALLGIIDRKGAATTYCIVSPLQIATLLFLHHYTAAILQNCIGLV